AAAQSGLRLSDGTEDREVRIGVVGSGFVGGSTAKALGADGHEVTVYSLEPAYVGNREAVAECDVVLLCVPTPSTPDGIDVSALRETMSLVGEGKIAVVKSTVVPGTCRRLQAENPAITVVHAPEFLTARNCEAEARRPVRNVVGHEPGSERGRAAAAAVLGLLPRAERSYICTWEEAELSKYGGNFFLHLKVLWANVLAEAAVRHGAEHARVAEIMAGDPRIGGSHLAVDHEGGRGAGGYCFPKDVKAFIEHFRAVCPDEVSAQALLEAAERYNCSLLNRSGKDQSALDAIYGQDRDRRER
ncbi:hypothetical protein ACFL26_01650, partial [Patescibacteria group bacterium]